MTFEVKNLQKSFGSKHVLHGVSFAAESGKALGLLGRNGAGKTTSIRIIMDVFPPDSGEVLLDGKPMNRYQTKIGYLPEEHGLYPRKQITEQLVYLAALRDMPSKEAKASISYWLERLGMSEYANKKLDTLSKGNQQKIQLAATLITNPNFIILDEPFSGLDPVNAALLKDIVKEQIQAGKIVLFSSHQMSYVEEFCDSIAILHEGRIVLSGSLTEIKRSYDRSIMFVRSQNLSAVQECCNTKLTSIVKNTVLHNDKLMVYLHNAEQKNQLLEGLASNNQNVDTVGVFEPSLNDIFVEYTGTDKSSVNGGIVK